MEEGLSEPTNPSLLSFSFSRLLARLAIFLSLLPLEEIVGRFMG